MLENVAPDTGFLWQGRPIEFLSCACLMFISLFETLRILFFAQATAAKPREMKNWILQYAEQSSDSELDDMEESGQTAFDPVSVSDYVTEFNKCCFWGGLQRRSH